MEALLQLEKLPAYSEVQCLDLAQVDLLSQERRSATHWTADKWEHTPQQGPGLMMVVVAHLSFIYCLSDPHDKASRPHTISHPVTFTHFLSVILACPAERVSALLHLLFSRDVDQQHLGCNTKLVTASTV